MLGARCAKTAAVGQRTHYYSKLVTIDACNTVVSLNLTISLAPFFFVASGAGVFSIFPVPYLRPATGPNLRQALVHRVQQTWRFLASLSATSLLYGMKQARAGPGSPESDRPYVYSVHIISEMKRYTRQETDV